jgi:class 3 adenylate cyclase
MILKKPSRSENSENENSKNNDYSLIGDFRMYKKQQQSIVTPPNQNRSVQKVNLTARFSTHTLFMGMFSMHITNLNSDRLFHNRLCRSKSSEGIVNGGTFDTPKKTYTAIKPPGRFTPSIRRKSCQIESEASQNMLKHKRNKSFTAIQNSLLNEASPLISNYSIFKPSATISTSVKRAGLLDRVFSSIKHVFVQQKFKALCDEHATTIDIEKHLERKPERNLVSLRHIISVANITITCIAIFIIAFASYLTSNEITNSAAEVTARITVSNLNAKLNGLFVDAQSMNAFFETLLRVDPTLVDESSKLQNLVTGFHNYFPESLDGITVLSENYLVQLRRKHERISFAIVNEMFLINETAASSVSLLKRQTQGNKAKLRLGLHCKGSKIEELRSFTINERPFVVSSTMSNTFMKKMLVDLLPDKRQQLWIVDRKTLSIIASSMNSLGALYQDYIPENKEFGMRIFDDKYLVSSGYEQQDLDWVVVLSIPSELFAGQIMKTYITNIPGVAFIVLLLSIFVSVLITNAISLPLKRISDKMLQVATLDFCEDEGRAGALKSFESEKFSNFKEINQIHSAMAAMTTALKSFSKYVPSDVVTLLVRLKREAVLGVDENDLTIMFTDIANFTSIAEDIRKEDLVTLMGEYFRELSQIIIASDGIVDKYIGDAVMSFWNAPLALEDHALTACTVALKIQKRLELLKKQWLQKGYPLINTRIGINTGLALVGNFGSPNRLNYTCLGDAVNLASRLEALNKIYSTDIIISESTYEQVKHVFLCRPLDIVAVKGKTQAVQVYELIDFIKDELSIDIEMINTYNKGYQFFLNGDLSKAANCFEEFLQVYPNDVPASKHYKQCVSFEGGSWNPVLTLNN